MGRSARKVARVARYVVAVSLAAGLFASGAVVTDAGAHPQLGDPQPADANGAEEGVGVQVNEPERLAGFRPAVHWDGTAEVDDQSGDLVYAGTGCSPANYAGVDVEGEIALVDSFEGQDPGDACLAYTFQQKMVAAEEAGAVGLVQVSDGEAGPGRADGAGIPGVEVSNEDGVPLRQAVRDGDTVNATLTVMGARTVPSERVSDEPCVDGLAAGVFECDGVDLLSFVPAEEFDGAGQSDLWGWTDPANGDEYVMMGKTNGVALFRVTDPTDPVYLGELPNPAVLQEVWHDIKVYHHHAFIVSESEPHGMTVFDLRRLRGVEEPREWDRDAFYPLPFAAHNVEINTKTGYAYIVGGNYGLVAPDQCLSGLHMVDISIPTTPTFAGCYAQDGGPGTLARTLGEPATELSPAAYVHDTQCVVYDGPDKRYTGREICVNSSETHVTIADVTNKLAPRTLAVVDYPNVGYTHQGWLTEDHKHFILGDELDETSFDIPTRNLLFDVSDLERPELIGEHSFDTRAITHNLYVAGGLAYHSNYSSGLRVTDTAPIAEGRLEEVAFFDTFPLHSETTFDGTWSNYPFFASGTIAVSGREEGLFLLRLQQGAANRPVQRGPRSEVPPQNPPPERAQR